MHVHWQEYSGRCTLFWMKYGLYYVDTKFCLVNMIHWAQKRKWLLLIDESLNQPRWWLLSGLSIYTVQFFMFIIEVGEIMNIFTVDVEWTTYSLVDIQIRDIVWVAQRMGFSSNLEKVLGHLARSWSWQNFPKTLLVDTWQMQLNTHMHQNWWL
jgi:hypothetical protein